MHWYGGKTLDTMLAVPETEIPGLFTRVRAALAHPAYGCAADAPIMVTEWGPNSVAGVMIPMSTPTAAPAGSQLAGIFAAADTPRWGYRGARIAHFLAGGNDTMVQAMVSGTFGTRLKAGRSTAIRTAT